MFSYFKIALLVLFFFSCETPRSNHSVKHPNIILFLVDDMGWQDTSVPFWNKKTEYNRRYRTPNMERLAAQGMKFTQAYATSVCSPTRVSLMTGMNAARHRVTNWTLDKDVLKPQEEKHDSLVFPLWNVNGLSPDPDIANAVHATPLPALLKKAGYETIHVGKAHLGAIGTPGENPLNLGFDVNIAGHAAGAPQSFYGNDNFGNTPRFKDSPWPVPGLEKYHGKDIFLTEALTREAVIAIEKSISKGKPFFLYMSLYAVHAPIMADHRFYQPFLDQGLDTVEAKYASMVGSMDKSLGDLMDFTVEKEIDDHTIILFMSDNGGLSAVGRGGEKHTHNKPLASGKGSIYEGGIREPMLVKWPGVAAPNSVCDNYLIIEDFYPSILKMAGIERPEFVQTIDGQSFVEMIRNPKATIMERPLFWHYPNEWGPTGPGIGAFSAIRKGDWKLIYYHQQESFELFNLRQDIGETQNLITTESQLGKQMANELSDYLKKVNAQMPIHKSTGMAVAWPENSIDAVLKH